MNKIQKARKVFSKAFDRNPDFRDTYMANIAMLLYDELHKMKYRPKLRSEDRNAVAEKVIDLIFYDER